MNFLGMGTLEIIVVLLIAFIFLGPERMVEVARVLGKWVGELKRMAAELPDLVIEDDDPPKRPVGSNSTTTNQGAPISLAAQQTSASKNEPDGEPAESGPVGHQRVTRRKAPEEQQTPPPEERP